jgi:hypothetical protein
LLQHLHVQPLLLLLARLSLAAPLLLPHLLLLLPPLQHQVLLFLLLARPRHVLRAV